MSRGSFGLKRESLDKLQLTVKQVFSDKALQQVRTADILTR